ncbi:MAG: hypothetical protein MJZ31_08580 [Bacteroidales bacterium]|nr:hypothetical protein [Bacteroidales bacterium]
MTATNEGLMSDVTSEQELVALMQGKDFADPNTPFIINLQGGHINRSYGHGGFKRDKAIKTIENGKVVIIRDGKKYNLSGMRLN